MTDGVLLFAHGTVEHLDDLTPFVTRVRRGHAPPPELIAELRRRYEAIGGRSPLLDITARLADKLAARTGLGVWTAMRLWKPFAEEVLTQMAAAGVDRVLLLPLAQHSSAVYAAAAERSLGNLPPEVRGRMTLVAPPNWGQEPRLLDAYAARIRAALDAAPASASGRTTVLLSAHSLPRAIIDAGDAYEREVRASAAAVSDRVRATRDVRLEVVFQSQGMSGPGERPVAWLGPTVEEALDAARDRGDAHIVFAPIGFLADHVEVLYDLDIEARDWAKARGMTSSRIASLNDADDLVETLAGVLEPLR